jgi:hypothetical protein
MCPLENIAQNALLYFAVFCELCHCKIMEQAENALFLNIYCFLNGVLRLKTGLCGFP